ncbi:MULTISPECIES: hypothetical protein [unclassified Erwinia]|uniref:hypothetical protein n=1 Tax=unclassified Erwinia TaxID=2622719 RepID=UPI00117882AC|nr:MULTISPECIES: hypothetical protein [unclassified Erwinia]
MPFFEPFRRYIQPGDLIYGLHEERTIFIGCNDIPEKVFPLCIDRYAVMAYEKKQQRINPHSQYHPKAPDQRLFLKMIKKHPKYRCIRKAKYHKDVNVARKCKGGLLWVTSLQADRHIHFLLDGLDIHSVVHKNNVRDSNDRQFKSITGSELRWIYRNRHNENVRNKIQFWRGFQAVCPPWAAFSCRETFSPWSIGTHLRQQCRELWSDYQPGSLDPVNNDCINCNIRCAILGNRCLVCIATDSLLLAD